MEQTNIQQTTGLQVFYNEETSVNLRTNVIGNEPWFIAQDICSILGLNNITKALAALDFDEKRGVTISNAVGNNQEVRAINESGLYHLIFISRKPEAKSIRRWVTGTVLPSIRRTGSYSVSNNRPESTKRLPLPKFRPYFGQWKENVKPYISRAELCLTAEKQRVTLGHVQKVYAGTSMSYPVAKCIQALAKKKTVRKGAPIRRRNPLTNNFASRGRNEVMATISVYNQCVRKNKERGVRNIRTGSFKPDLIGLFGEKILVNQFQLNRCSEAEKRRHLHQDRILRFLYIESNSNL